MPKPRRRRRFFALEGRIEVDDSGEPLGIVDDDSVDASPATATAVSGEADPRLHGLAEEPAVPASPADDLLPPAFRLNRTARPQPAPARLVPLASVALALACLLLGGLAGFLWSEFTRKPTAAVAPGVAPKITTPLTVADQHDLDEAYAARHAHAYREAERLFAAVGGRHAGMGPLEVEVGRTLLYAGQPIEAISILRKAIDKDWKPAEANFLLAMLSKSRQSYAEAEASFSKAVENDPTQPDYYFFWGECLREEGKLLDATAKFRSALLRNQYETAIGLYRAKLWLCAIEADQAAVNGVGAEVDAYLLGPHPPMEAFVAAAARDVKAGDLRAAAAHLTSASQRADPVVFDYVMSDPLFVPLRSRPEFAEFFQVAPSTSRPAAESAASPTPAANH